MGIAACPWRVPHPCARFSRKGGIPQPLPAGAQPKGAWASPAKRRDLHNAIPDSVIQYNPASAIAMRKAALLYNPLSGSRHHRRLADVKAASSVLREAGIEVIVTPTQAAPGTAEQVNEAIAQ